MKTNLKLIKDINKIQKNLFKNNNPELIIANDALNIVKGHPEYLNIFKKHSFFKFFYFFFKYSIFNFYHLLCSLTFIRPNNINLKKNLDHLIISHLIVDKKKSDINHKEFYFNEFEKNSFFRKKKNFKIYINHTKKFKKGFYNKKVVILPKYSNFKYYLFHLLRLYYLFFKYFFYSMSCNTYEAFLFKKIAIEFINPKTLNNLSIKKNLEKIFFNSEIKKVFFTFEGFPWERFLCLAVKKNVKNCQIFGYQFAVLLKHQNSMFAKIPKIYFPDVVLTSGVNNYKILKKFFSKVFIIGSSRFMKKKNNNLKKNNCLVLPEGIDSECILLLNFIIKNASRIPNIKFIIRFHPLTNVSKIKKYLHDNIKIKNLEISTKSLSYDLKRSSFCLHRGSTSAISATQNGLMPFYLNDPNDLNIDPMFQISKKGRYLNNFSGFNGLIKRKPYIQKRFSENIRKKAKQFFIKFDNNKLKLLLNNQIEL